MNDQKKGFNSEDIIGVIEDWTVKTVAEKTRAQEILLNDKLLPELKKEMAVQEMQERELLRMQTEHEIRNLAAKFVLLLKGGFFEEAYQCFALEEADTYANVEKYGIYRGKDKLHEYFVKYYSKIGGGEGCFMIHELTTPVIELAGDGETAKAMFSTQGILAVDTENWMKAHDVARSVWQFGPWYMDFKKEHGMWKIWHLTIYDEIENTYEESWSERSSHDEILYSDAPKPSEAAGELHYFHAGRAPYLHQEPPVPYKSYTKEAGIC